MATETPSRPTITIQPTKGWLPVNLRELWAYRELLYFLVWRDIKVRYKQTVLGVAWVVIQPLLMAMIFAFIFAQVAGLPTGGVPGVLFFYVALLPWNLFARGLSEGSTSLVSNERLITKVFLPRLILPASTVISALVDFSVALAVGIGLMLYYGVVPTIAVVTLPLFVAIAVMAAMGVAFWLSAVDARYRDIRYTLPFITQIWFFATVVIPLNSVPESLRWLYSLNPMVGVVEGFRWALLGTSWTFDPFILLSLVIVVSVFIGGLFYFRRTEKIFADVV